MTTASISAASTTAAATSTSSTIDSQLAALGRDINQFLKLLTTQLQNQDPLNPMDNAQMTSQLIGYASVQQEAGANTRLDKLIALQQANSGANGLGYLGKQVEASGDQVVLSDGSAQVVYELAETADSVLVELLNSSGQTVLSTSGATSNGVHRMAWSGRDDYGNQMADGAYTLRVTATGQDASTVIGTTTRTTGKVTGVDMSNGDTVLDIGPITAKMSSVLTVK